MAISLPMVVGLAVWPWVLESIGASAYSSANLYNIKIERERGLARGDIYDDDINQYSHN